MHGVRSAGPFWLDATETVAHAYREYWKTGVTGGNAADVAELGNSGQGFVNPMFAISSAPAGDYAVHYGTEPLLGFSLAQAYHRQARADSRDVVKSAEEIVKAAKSQFGDWCSSFKKYLDNGRVAIRLFDGDASTFCHELQLELTVDGKHAPRAYIKPWSSHPLLLDGYSSSAPLEAFDVIDTSNLSDHIGMINMLTATVPLLRRKLSTVLYTETLLMASEKPHEILSSVLGCDVATFSLLLGIAPVGLLSGVTMEATASEIAMLTFLQSDKQARQCRIRVPWKTLESSDNLTVQNLNASTQGVSQVSFESQALAGCLFRIYRTMFAHEDVARLTQMMTRMSIGQHSTDMERYTRAAMVALLRLIKVRGVAEWDETMRIFIEKVENDRSLIIGSNSLQELFMHLHYFGVWTTDVLRNGPRHIGVIPLLALRSRSSDDGLLAEAKVPAVVHIIFTVPRKALGIFTSRSADLVGTPALHVSICQTDPGFAYENIFSSFQSFFGRLVSDNTKFDECIVVEDDRGWKGSSDLIVSCPVPTFGLLTGSKDGIRLSLVIKSSPSTIATFAKYTGLRLQVFETHLKEDNKVRIYRDAPKLSSRDSFATQQRWIEVNGRHRNPLSPSTAKLTADFSISHLQNHLDFSHGSPESKALSTGSVVKVVEASPSTVTLHIGSTARTVCYPFHVQGSQSKIRVARKSSWIEVEVPIHTAPAADTFDSWTQLLLPKGQPPVLWSISKINLAIQPKINLPPGADRSWLTAFLGLVLSDSEHALSKLNQVTTISPKYDLKQSLNNMFGSFAGLHHQASSSPHVFQLCVEKSCHTIILANGLRHDLDLGSIVLDAWVVPLTISRVHELNKALGQMQQKQPVGIILSQKESILWKRLLPALAERCRTWSHKGSCEYLEGGVPLSTAEEKPSLCSCGQGQVPPDFAKENKDWKPFAKYATRIAIAPIFPVPYVEPSISQYMDVLNSARNGTSQDESSTPRCLACGKSSGELKVCSRCGNARFCDQACQKAAWKSHKSECKAS